ncbi:DNA-directed DNA polymerase [Tanacetum coccineum]|uniref:DNA-directed DNA polymerase n=1 Tax=Tanacetum coccineum TaxID=301880 RepID=A0ABQ4ZNJ4_9ASTR
MQPSLRGRLKRACKQLSFLKTPTREVGLKNPYLICDYCRGSYEADECEQSNPSEQVCLSGGDIYNDPSLLRFYQNNDTSPWGNSKRKEKEEDGPEWIVRTINKTETPEPEAPTFAITTRSGTSTQDPPFPAPPRSATDNFTMEETEKEGSKDAEPSITQEPTPRTSILYQPSKTSNPPFPSRLKKQKKDDEDEWLLSIFKQIYINLPFLKAMIHMPKGAKVLKDLLLHKEKLEKASSSVKISEECSAIIQRHFPQKEGDPGISKLKPTKMSIQLADRSIKYPVEVCENLLVKVIKFIFPVNFVVLEMDEDELVLIILGRPFLATARVVIDVHDGKLSLRVRSETITFNIRKHLKSKHSQDDYLYCVDHTVKLVQEQWVDTVNDDGKWTEEEEGEDSNKPLEWKASEDRLKASSVKPPKLKLKELPKHLEYAFL